MLSPDGRSRMWDASANGYARGDGIAAIILKTLHAALADGDDIECVIRETAFGQDGKTQGITAPSHSAQTQLIRDCYSRAGLDLSNPADRPQFFECHGTGTLAGDAAEAEAISNAFFSGGNQPRRCTSGPFEKLTVGSIKSVLGHTEGTAGLAGILKASLALQHATFPPNLLFKNLNPRIKPFYSDLQLLTAAAPWPSPVDGRPRRASVNSFGFGGANAHAILESYVPREPVDLMETASQATVFTPFVFSAYSEKSLISYLQRFREYLSRNASSVSLRDLAYTLHTRRTGFQITTAIAASTVDDLCAKLDDKLNKGEDVADQPVAVRVSRDRASESGKPRLLGVFTGQGAQWAGMGVQLLQSSTVARQILEHLETRLFELPDPPSWSLIQELQKEPSSSRIGEAMLSQPLCTAIQILQVDLLRAAGIEFIAVVGHSSGEIAAAYAAGFISAEDAICIAYYRGVHSKLASGTGGKPGSMLAVGTSPEDAQEVCDDTVFKGRACIAAINSPISVTISGDRDAVECLKAIFDDKHKFARVLRVDKAYHSHHMLHCSNAYLKSLAELDIKTSDVGKPTWYSSVFDGEKMSSNHEHVLKGAYWDLNMTRPVNFRKAVSSACTAQENQFDLAIELGPHPALKGPALQNIQEELGKDIPYTGLFHRGVSAVESVAEGLGYIWTHLGKDAVDLQSYDRYVSGEAPCRLVKGLPTYSWDHDEYWNESRYAKAIRLRPGPVHELLGHTTPDSSDQDIRWRHILRPTEIPWLMGHRLQDQIVFPGAGYIVTAVEASLALCNKKGASASLVELADFEFGRALVFEDDDSSVEIVVSMADIIYLGSNAIIANFRYHAADGSSLNLMATARAHIHLGEPITDALPARLPKPLNLLKVRAADFYSASRDLEYQWDGPFAALDQLERKLGATTGVLNIVEPSELLIHPALIDAAIQAVLLAYSFPGDGQLWTIHLPGKIKRVSINPTLCGQEVAKGEPLPFDASHHPDMVRILGDTSVYPSDPGLDNAIIQVEGLECFPLSRASPQDDKEAFATIVWDVAHPDAQTVAVSGRSVTPEEVELARQLERMVCFYMTKLARDVPSDDPSRLEGPYKHFLQFTSDAISSAQAGDVPFWPREWEYDEYEQLASACEPLVHTVDMQILQIVGQSITDVVRGNKPKVELDNELIAKFHSNALGPRIFNGQLARTVKQVTHRYPHLNILEIGAGTGATTRAVLKEIGQTFSSYTFTNASADVFEPAKSWAAPHLNKLIFKTLDISRDPVPQYFVEQSYDMIVASLALCPTPNLERTLHNIRRLLRPGGQLIVVKLQPTKSPVYGFIFSAFPEWWQGAEEDRAPSPVVSLVEWDALLRKTGFSGCDTTIAEAQEQNCIANFAVLVSQAVDDKIVFLRNPLSAAPPESSQPNPLIQDMIIVGGTKLEITELVEDITNLVRGYCVNIRTARTLSELSSMDMSSDTTVLSLAQLDGPIFEYLTHEVWEAFRDLVMSAGVLLWVTQGRRADNPFASIMPGLMRSIIREVPTISYQVLDLEGDHEINAQLLSSALLRFKAETVWQRQDQIHTSVETELVLDKKGRLLIPRLMISQDMNDRYNSFKRSITTLISPHSQNVRVAPADSPSGYGFQQEAVEKLRHDGNMVQIGVTHSFLSAVRISEFGCMFVILGYDRGSGDQVMALSTNHSSISTPFISSLSKGLFVKTGVKVGYEASFMSLVACRLVSSFILRGLSMGDAILVYEPDQIFAEFLAREAETFGVHVTFITSSIQRDEAPGGFHWLKIHHSVSDSALSRLLPTEISVYVDFSASKDSEPTRNRIQALLPTCCRQENLATLFSTTACAPRGSQVRSIHEHLKEAAAYASFILEEMKITGQTSRIQNRTVPRITPDSLAESDSKPAPYSLVDWTACSKVPAQIRPVDTQISFSNQKTYWLAGLSGGLGLGLCEWMFRRGARYFVISSRRPKNDPSWLEDMRELGATIKVASCDVTVKEQVVALHTDICSNMPPIAGVAQGSMVLDDTPIREMTLGNLLTTTRPKVEGSINLNDLFQRNDLDFFVFFSSAISVVGRPGQVNYGAANTFMTCLAEQRRRRGLAASVIHIGPIYGIGYAMHVEKAIFTKAAFRSTALVATSERDFYQLFAEAVIAGRPDSGWNTVELFSGARRISPHENDKPVWEAEPLMSHFIRNSDGVSLATSDSQSRVPLKTQLAEANDRSQIHNIIQTTFLPKLHNLFQLDPNKVTKDALVGMRLDELGIDSLVAVEIRSWFMKTFEVNIPVLKILSGVLIGDLIATAAETIPDELVPNLRLD